MIVFLVINITDISLLMPVVTSQCPEDNRILAEEHIEAFPVTGARPELFLAEQPGYCPGHCLANCPEETVIQPDHSLDPFPFYIQCTGVISIQHPRIACEYVFQDGKELIIFWEGPVRTPENGIHFYERDIQDFSQLATEGCFTAAAGAYNVYSHQFALEGISQY